MRTLILALAIIVSPIGARADVIGSVGAINVEQIADDLFAPWAIGFLPSGETLITERDGLLWVIAPDGSRQSISGLPEIAADGQGGLLDILVPQDFSNTRELIFVFAKPQGRGLGTAIGRGILSDNSTELTDVRVLFEMTPGSRGGRHFGGRVVEGPNGHLFLTIGERGDRQSAQDVSRHNGSVIRINRDGSVPNDNPLVGHKGAQPEIWSFGHRNPQGMAFDQAGQLWVNEHGARGGDEVNKIEKGANYGWPIISYGRHYSGLKIGEGTTKSGLKQPKYYWDPSIAPSGMMIYSGKLWPEWRGDMFVGSLKFDYISRLTGRTLTEAEQLSSNETIRVRDIREAPDGSIWFLSVGNNALYRMTPG